MELLRRKIDDKLLAWKLDPEHKPLIVKGARQIGKTESIRKFAGQNFENVIEINFALQKLYLLDHAHQFHYQNFTLLLKQLVSVLGGGQLLFHCEKV